MNKLSYCLIEALGKPPELHQAGNGEATAVRARVKIGACSPVLTDK
jgi:hypothetical protein